MSVVPPPSADSAQEAGGSSGFPPVRKREIFGWCCFDFANSAFTTIIITVVYAVYFANVVAAGDSRAEGWWGSALAASQCVVILLSPLLGSYADVTARKKTLLMSTALVCSVATALLFFVGPGSVMLALGLVMVANIAFSLSENICAAFLPEISTASNVGRISGFGWSFGYFGGLLSLVLALVILQSGDGRATWTFLMTGAFFFGASLPTLILLRERARPCALQAGESFAGRGWQQLRMMRRELPQHRTLAIFFLALTFYLSGLMAVVGFAALYATKVIGMTQDEVIKLFILLQIAGVAGAFGFGILQDRVSSKLALILAILLWVGVCIWASVCDTKGQFYIIGALAGAAMGALQSSSRAVVASLTPPGRAGEFFGYWGFFGKLAGVIGPLLFGWLATLTDYRVAIVATGALFMVGLLILLPLRLKPTVVEA